VAVRLGARDLARLGSAARKAASPVSGKKREVVADAVPRGGRLARMAYAGQSITVGFDLAPQPKERARTFVDDRSLARAFASAGGDMRRFMASVKGKGDGGIMRSVTPEHTRTFEEAAALVAGRAMAGAKLAPFTCPLLMLVEFRFEGVLNEWPTGYSDGDLDNLEKALKDALNQVAYADDRLIVAKAGIKNCAPKAGITMTLAPAPPEISLAMSGGWLDVSSATYPFLGGAVAALPPGNG
jgi:Holliday junction resolvase RusA-like endonuclease